MPGMISFVRVHALAKIGLHFRSYFIIIKSNFDSALQFYMTWIDTCIYGGPQRQYTNIYHITAFYILLHKHIHWLCGYIYQYNKIYISTTICIPVKKYKFQYKNKSFGTEKYFLKTLEKIGRYFIYDHYYVPKYIYV